MSALSATLHSWGDTPQTPRRKRAVQPTAYTNTLNYLSKMIDIIHLLAYNRYTTK